MVTNQTTIIGPKTRPTLAVPRFWTRNSANRMATVIGTTNVRSAGVTTSRPSTAPRTEIAGVMMPSPYRSDAPNKPSAMRISAGDDRRRGAAAGESARAARASPPSPRLSARRMKTRYLTLTTMISDQTMSERTPYTFAVSRAPARARP